MLLKLLHSLTELAGSPSVPACLRACVRVCVRGAEGRRSGVQGRALGSWPVLKRFWR